MTTLPMNPIEAGDQTSLASNKISQAVMLISSGTAARWMERNVRNRPLSPVTVEKYRRDMVAGQWVYAADPIRFDSMGNLLDGQHRLTALAMCEDLTLPFLVVRGLPAETQMVMDQGRKRNAGQQLALKGVKNSSAVAAAAKVTIMWEEGLLFRDNKAAQVAVTSPRIEAWVAENYDLIESVGSYYSAIRNNDAPPSVAFAAAIRFAQINPDQAHAFYLALANGGTGMGHPINTLDKRLQRVRREGLKMPQRDYLSLFILAWNAYRDGRQMSKFQRPRGGRWSAENFPEPK